MVQYLEQRGIRLFASVIQGRLFQPPVIGGVTEKGAEMVLGAEIVGDTAEATGGYHVTFTTGDPVKAFDKSKGAVRQLYNLIASFYVLDLQLPEEPRKTQELKLTVTDINGNTEKGMTVMHPRNPFLCAAQQERDNPRYR